MDNQRNSESLENITVNYTDGGSDVYDSAFLVTFREASEDNTWEVTSFGMNLTPKMIEPINESLKDIALRMAYELKEEYKKEHPKDSVLMDKIFDLTQELQRRNKRNEH
jgi:hypothetical protein